MGYFNGEPNGTLYLGSVKWSNDYKNVMLFSSREERNSFLTENLNLVKENVIFINPNRYVDVDAKLSGIDNYNYCFFKNDSDISNLNYCCFITDYEYIAPRTTRLYLELDVFQMYHYTTNYYQSFIERAIVTPGDNTTNRNFLPEPISAPLEYEQELNTVFSDSDWAPTWVLHSASYYNNTKGEYQYTGYGTDNTFGEYGRFIDDTNELAQLLKMYGRKPIGEAISDLLTQINEDIDNFTANGKTVLRTILMGMLSGGVSTVTEWNDMTGLSTLSGALNISEYQDHRDELIGLYAIPTWLKNAYTAGGGDANYASNKRITSNEVALTVNTSSLANGYIPRNKKLLTSVCRGYALINRTGLQIPFKPELFTNAPKIKLYGITMSTSGYQYEITNYSDLVKSFGEVNYSSERRVGYDANTGINKALAIIGAGTTITSGAAQIASGNPAAVLSGAGTIGGGLVSAIDSLGTREAHFGNNGDLLRITGGRPRLRWIEVSPTYSQCEVIDSFFDMFGYTIQKHVNPLKYLYQYHIDSQTGKTIYEYDNPIRSNWEYIKTDNINMRVHAPADYENKLKSIFNNGVTFWNDYDSFGDYSETNGTP